MPDVTDRVLIRSALLSCAALLTLVLAVSFATERRAREKVAAYEPPIVEQTLEAFSQPRVRTRSSR